MAATTKDQQAEAERLRQLPGRYRVKVDAEGWPLIPGRLGQIEPHDRDTLAVFTGRSKMIARLLAVPGVRRRQTGDREARMLFCFDALPAVAALIKARYRTARVWTAEQRQVAADRLKASREAPVQSAEETL